MPGSDSFFCPDCLEMWTWVEETGCRGMAAACEPFGPAQVLAKQLERGYFFLADTLAALMLVYWDKLDWQMPTHIIPMTLARFPNWSQSARQTRWLADCFSQRLLGCSSKSWRSIPSMAEAEVLLISLRADESLFDQMQTILYQRFPKRVRLLSFLPE